METRSENLVPFRAVHPGEVLKEELKERGIKQKDFAQQIGMQASHLSELIKGKRNVSQELAEKLDQSLGIPAIFWLNMQTGYEHDKRVIEQRGYEELEAEQKLQVIENAISLKEIYKWFKIRKESCVERLKYVENLLKLTNFKEMQVTGMFRKSDKTGMDEKQIRTWMCIAQIEAKSGLIEKEFFESSADDIVEQLRKVFNENKNTIERTESILQNNGIKFCIVPKLDKASIDGYSFLDGKTPCIVVTKRYDRIDNFAFSVMHELGHVYLHLGKINGEFVNIYNYNKESTQEKEADRFANEALIPNKIWQQVPAVKVNIGSMQRTLTRWAEEKGMNKWVVLGRASYELGMYQFKDDGTRRIN